ncbi:NAD(P)-binding protein [Lojkania enalia]|uniref:D-xylose 1-dehydrogenase (NADP(+), D-xylono-1,5-lactone-forming) n=1 Tax=Lojkania enalia TaxID=147567 RepID=A0A9P4JXN6_9PLEO|nr:NAD(P)-binding protein [Didymosphaeria enalia]
MISSWFVSDIVRDPVSHYDEHEVRHVVQAIGSSSIEKAKSFVEKHISSSETSTFPPTLYASYKEVYNDPNVDIVYVGTPHSLHMQNTIDAINAGKHMLCEKPMAINAKEAETMVNSARDKGHMIGEPRRTLIDFGLDMPFDKLDPNSRSRDPQLGAGSLLDIRIYSLIWASMIFHSDLENQGSALMLNNGADEMAAVAICTASDLYKLDNEFGRIEGTEGSIIIYGGAASKPSGLILRRKGEDPKTLDFPVDGWGLYNEADAVAKNIRDVRQENDITPLDETLRIMRVMGEVCKQNGLKYSQDQ